MEFTSHPLRALLSVAAVPSTALLALSGHLLRKRRGEYPEPEVEAKRPGAVVFPEEQALNDLRCVITREAVTLVEQTLAAKKKRREPIPFPASIDKDNATSAVLETAHSYGSTSMNTPSTNTTLQAVGPDAKHAKLRTPASPAGGIPRPRRNWAELLAQNRPADRIVAPLAAIVAAGSESSGQKRLAAPAGAPSRTSAPIIEKGIPRTPAKTWEQVQARVFAEIPLPAGIHDGYILNRLVQSRRPISGLVVSIGISATTVSHASVPAEIRNLVRSLLGLHDFACASAPDEYLLIFPDDQGAAAQKRLGEIAQKLWDFQLRMLGLASILFSWGGVEVHGEAIDEAIASANDRMQETRRTRSAKSLEKHGLRIAG